MVATIEYIEQVIDTYHQAAEANRRTPGRQGSVVHITAEMADDVLVTADLHGNRRNFNAIKKLADLTNRPRRHLVMQEVCHGGPTYPSNGGCMSHAMLEDVAKLKAAHPEQVHFILSNHELAELTDYPILKSNKMLNLMFRLGMQESYGPAAEKVREAFKEFLGTCPLAVSLPGGVFICHTIPEKVDSRGFDQTVFDRELEGLDFKENSPAFNLVWGRDFRQANADAFAKLVGAQTLIHGHEPCPDGYDVPNDTQVILDCCTEKAHYALLPTDRELPHAEVVKRIKPLHAPAK